MTKRQIPKIKHRAKRLIAAVVAIIIGHLFVLSPGIVSAATTPTARGSITVSPAIVNLTLSSGEQSANTTVTLSNTYSNTIRLVAEWQAIDEATGRLIPSGPLNPTLTQSLRISETDITIPAQSSKQVKVAVQNNPALAPGGHYAILVFTVVASGKEKLGLQSALSVTVFVVKRDGAKTAISLNNLLAKHNLFSLPQKARLELTNTGNVHVVPRAAVTIERRGEVIAKAVVNEASSPLLPGKKSSYGATFTTFKHVYWPSRLQLRAVYRVDQSGEAREQVSSFWYVPTFWLPILLCIVTGLYVVVRKGPDVFKLLRGKVKRQRKRSKRQANDKTPKDKPQRESSKILVSSVEVSPSHIVPVEHGTPSKKK